MYFYQSIVFSSSVLGKNSNPSSPASRMEMHSAACILTDVEQVERGEQNWIITVNACIHLFYPALTALLYIKQSLNGQGKQKPNTTDLMNFNFSFSRCIQKHSNKCMPPHQTMSACRNHSYIAPSLSPAVVSNAYLKEGHNQCLMDFLNYTSSISILISHLWT